MIHTPPISSEARDDSLERECSQHRVDLYVNGRTESADVPAWTTLLDFLRERLALTGTKKGCDHGQCGACTVLVNGQRINSCLTLAVMQRGAEVTTVEGLAGVRAGEGGAAPTDEERSLEPDALHPLQKAFIEHDAFQCGYCTPGQLCSAVGLLAEGGVTTLADIRERMSGNLCRCGAYPQIVRAVAEIAGIPVNLDGSEPSLGAPR